MFPEILGMTIRFHVYASIKHSLQISLIYYMQNVTCCLLAITLWNMERFSSLFHCCHKKWFVHKLFEAFSTNCVVIFMCSDSHIWYVLLILSCKLTTQLRHDGKFQQICVQVTFDHSCIRMTKCYSTLLKVIAKNSLSICVILAISNVPNLTR